LQVVTQQKLYDLETRWNSTEVTVIFPDGSEFYLTGEAVPFHNDAELIVGRAMSSGRGNGFFHDTISFIRRIRGESENFEISFIHETEAPRPDVVGFTRNYNNELEMSGPRIYEDRIVMVKGAGQVSADADEVFDFVLGGLFHSFSTGQPVVITYDLPQSSLDMEELFSMWQDISVRPLSAQYDPVTRSITQCVVGVGFDLVGAMTLLGWTESGKTISFEVVHTPPEVRREYLESVLFRDLIGEETTHIAGSANRLNNITLASEAIDGLVLDPGEEFSFNRVVGVRSTARGYRAAPAIISGNFASTVGGGICQVSSTLYSAIMDTNILFTERRPHSRPIPYLPRGRDATVFWGLIDFRFVNNTEYPLRIDITIDERLLTVQVFGTIPDEWLVTT
jgi:hypothetical protein